MRRIERYDVSSIERPTRADLERLARRRLDARRRGNELVLTGVGERLRLLLAVTGLEEVFLMDGGSSEGGPDDAPEPEGLSDPGAEGLPVELLPKPGG
ncbi:hypothetical protein KGQ19_08195 [Catenulispora sp. NL8]|uniref:STAS domain-containing protein n=1 Tax=Catenulispora pinistramenti TaxID=2705254 RepID=A0ABS5KLD4_9ACTN|nr:hypothetical protein [Catenulispora pinistramenti]MBS2546848.1 hypothetical protein [Catenulispora pinistramenti]